MPTIEQKLTQRLVDNGLFEDMAEKIMQQIKADDNGTMQGRWGDSIEDYPDIMLAVLWVTVRDTALEWIDENLPNAWFRPLFAE